jgi:hypothetical protein
LRFWKISSFNSKPKGASLRFYKKNVYSRQKTSRKSVFRPHETHILAWLDTMVLYTMVLMLLKISSFHSKHKMVSLQFYRQTSVHGKNGSKNCISSPWGSYSCSVRHYGVAQIFWGFEKYQVSAQNSKGLAFGFNKKLRFTAKMCRKFIFHPRDAQILAQLKIMMYNIFWGFIKYRVLAQNPMGLAFGFIEKHLFTTKTDWKFIFHPRETHILAWLNIMVLHTIF